MERITLFIEECQKFTCRVVLASLTTLYDTFYPRNILEQIIIMSITRESWDGTLYRRLRHLITSTPKPPITKKRTESSSSDEDSDDEADSDNGNNVPEKTEKKKQLTKTRKKNSGIIHF